MAGKDVIVMSTKEARRIQVIYSVINGHILQQEAANILSISCRQVRRSIKRVKEEGDIALVHRSRGKPSNRAMPDKIKEEALKLCNTTYQGFGPTLAAETLFEMNKIQIHSDTLRRWFIESAIEYKKRKSKKHRCWRPRKECFGQMNQLDGSHHAWFEDRGPKCVLMGHVDDATSRVYANFYDYEGTIPAMDSFKRYIRRYGIPQSVYLDKHSTYKSTAKPTLEDELNNAKALSQFERALTELGVEVIHADSPQAKGRVERSFKTHQDRLIKQMRLRDISNIKDANEFLHSYYIPNHNRKFAVIAKDKANLHMPIPKHINLDRVFCIKNKACLRNDFTVQYNNKFYQILDTTRAKEVTIEDRLNGRLYIYDKDTQLKYKLIDKKPQKPRQNKPYKPRKRYVPPADHPYKLLFKRLKRKCA
jgi:transposase